MRKLITKKMRFMKLITFGILLATFLIAPVFAGSDDSKSVFSAPKSPPEGFSLIVEPNVLLLLDTSGSMTFFMDNDDKTGGDGSKPYGNYKYYGKDKNPGPVTEGTNNIVDEENNNYHPKLGYIPDITEDNVYGISREDGTHTQYFAYDEIITDKWRKAILIEAERISLPNSSTVEYRFVNSGSGINRRVAIEKRTLTDSDWWGNAIWSGWSYIKEVDTVLMDTFGQKYRYKTQGGSSPFTSLGLETCLNYAYKYPNDSRMYALKNVLWRIFSDEALIDGLRIGVATYNHSDKSPGSSSNYYYWAPTTTSWQRINWTGAKDGAKLIVEFDSTKKEEHVAEIMQWFDGEEDSNNLELRAHGGTPLADSIYKTGKSAKSALQFFDEAIQYWCQPNFLIVLTDGADESFNVSSNKKPDVAPDAVANLYNNANITFGDKSALPIETRVIGMINPDEQDDLARILAKMADYGKDGTINDANYELKKEKNWAGTYKVWKHAVEESDAYFATDFEKLLGAFESIFKEIQDVAATGSAPLVNPPNSAGAEGKVYSTGFKPSSVRQWTGFLSSHTIEDNVIGNRDWEAGAKLHSIENLDDRLILTADWQESSGSSKYNSTNLKKFTTENASHLKTLVARDFSIDSDKFRKFVRWVRGHDEWRETDSGKRWRLGDPFHVGLVEVGEPQSLLTDPAYISFKEDIAREDPIVYMHANDGMLHAFRSSDGKEEWAFIPPNVLNFPRLIGTKVEWKKDEKKLSWISDDKVSVPRYLLDGPVVAEDILLNGNYRTVLLGALGRAGAGLYALDITDGQKPKFLWALDNNCYDASGALKKGNFSFLKWSGSDGSASSTLSERSSTTSSELGRLRLTVSTPFVGTVDLKDGSNVKTEWIALLGAGAKNNPEDPDEKNDDGGKSVIALNMKSGDLVKELTHDMLGSVVAPISIETGPRPMRIRKFFLGDDEGSIFEGDLSSYDKNEWDLKRIFRPGESVSQQDLFTIPYEVEIGLIKNQKWLFWGTGDPDWLFGERRGKCYMFAMNRSMVGDSEFTLDDLPELVDLPDDEYDDRVAVSPKGWRLELKEGETVSTPPVLYQGYIFFATYKKPLINDDPEDIDPCSVGESELYIVKADTGLGGFVKKESGEEVAWKKSVTFEGAKISGITISDGKIYVGITSFSKNFMPDKVLEDYAGDVTYRIDSNLLVFENPAPDAGGSGSSSEKTQPAYWRDWRP